MDLVDLRFYLHLTYIELVVYCWKKDWAYLWLKFMLQIINREFLIWWCLGWIYGWICTASPPALYCSQVPVSNPTSLHYRSYIFACLRSRSVVVSYFCSGFLVRTYFGLQSPFNFIIYHWYEVLQIFIHVCVYHITWDKSVHVQNCSLFPIIYP